ncbi:interleukin-22 [Dendropsophus ebraccatus]|uniref:interleukin-22 n=1 Tax=Dendropsophus ebraccatus TaxID=150705 RepID=UPI00383212DC
MVHPFKSSSVIGLLKFLKRNNNKPSVLLKDKDEEKCAERLGRKSKTTANLLHYEFMLRSYESSFTSLISSLSHNPKRLFDTLNSLLKPKVQTPITNLCAEDIAYYFKEKIDTIRQEIISQPSKFQGSKDITRHSQCTLKLSYFLQTVLKRNIFSLAEQARLLDRDNDNKIFGSYLFNNIKGDDHCFLMGKVVGYVMENVLFDEFIQGYAHMEDAIAFLGTVDRALEGCNSENEEQVVRNVESMKNKMKMLGAEGKNKAIGELDLLFGYLRKCAFFLQRL